MLSDALSKIHGAYPVPRRFSHNAADHEARVDTEV